MILSSYLIPGRWAFPAERAIGGAATLEAVLVGCCCWWLGEAALSAMVASSPGDDFTATLLTWRFSLRADQRRILIYHRGSDSMPRN